MQCCEISSIQRHIMAHQKTWVISTWVEVIKSKSASSARSLTKGRWGKLLLPAGNWAAAREKCLSHVVNGGWPHCRDATQDRPGVSISASQRNVDESQIKEEYSQVVCDPHGTQGHHQELYQALCIHWQHSWWWQWWKDLCSHYWLIIFHHLFCTHFHFDSRIICISLWDVAFLSLQKNTNTTIISRYY